MNNFTISIKETAKTMEFTITFEEPYRTDDKFAANGARVRIWDFIQRNRIQYSRHTKTKRVDDYSFKMGIWK
jgi:hypothetical protein